MRTEELIAALADGTTPVRRHAVERRVLSGLVAGVAVTMMLVGVRGLRPDLPGAMMTGPFLMNGGYAVALTSIAVLAVLQAARPDRAPRALQWAIVPLLAMAVLAAIELGTAPFGQWRDLVMGRNSWHCTVEVALLSLPLFGGLLWAFRAMAPVRLRLAGAALGLAAGAGATALHILHCTEQTAAFMLSWHTLAIGLAVATGALAGPRLLRW